MASFNLDKVRSVQRERKRWEDTTLKQTISRVPERAGEEQGAGQDRPDGRRHHSDRLAGPPRRPAGARARVGENVPACAERCKRPEKISNQSGGAPK